MTRTRRHVLRVCVTASAAASLVLAGCSSSSGKSDDSLTKAQFITQMNAACVSVLNQVRVTPAPTSAKDFAALLKLDAFIEVAEPEFQQAAAALVARSPDAAALRKNWLDPDAADFAAQKPYLLKFDAAARAKDATKLAALVSQASSLPDHSSAEAKYLTSYGLTSCASLALDR